jgi:NitT/TauT family transport system permease protein
MSRSGTRRRRFLSAPTLLMTAARIAVIAGVFALWELVVAVGITTEFWLSRPSLVAERVIDIFSTGEVWTDIWVTLQATVLGFAIGCGAGGVLGFILGMWPRFGAAVDPVVMAFNSTPRIALGPLFVLYFGIGIASKVALAVSLVFFIMLLNTRAGVMSADRDLVNAVRTMGGGRFFILRKVLAPGTVPWLLSGARISLAFALIAVVVGEIIVSQRGLGHMIAGASASYDTTGVFAVMIILAVGAIGADQCLLKVERAWTQRFGT